MNSELDLSEASVQLIELVDLSDEEVAIPAQEDLVLEGTNKFFTFWPL